MEIEFESLLLSKGQRSQITEFAGIHRKHPLLDIYALFSVSLWIVLTVIMSILSLSPMKYI